MLLRNLTNYLSNFHWSQHSGLQIIFLRFFNTKDNRKQFKISLTNLRLLTLLIFKLVISD